MEYDEYDEHDYDVRWNSSDLLGSEHTPGQAALLCSATLRILMMWTCISAESSADRRSPPFTGHTRSVVIVTCMTCMAFFTLGRPGVISVSLS